MRPVPHFAGHDELEASEIISAVLAMTSYTSGEQLDLCTAPGHPLT